MNTCPDKEILERLLEGELDDATMNDVMNHLSQCDACKGILDSLIADDERFLRFLLRTKPGATKHHVPPGGEKCLSPLLLLAYITGSLSKEQLMRVESHLGTCDHCILQLQKIQKLHMTPGELDFDLSFLDVAGEESERLEEKILSIVLRAQHGIRELIRQTGQLLVPPVPTYSVRGQEVSEAADQGAFTIQKDFPDKDLSLEVTVRKGFSGGSTWVGVSAMALSREGFSGGMEFVLSGSGREGVRKTDEYGVVEFSDVSEGHYAIRDKTGDVVSLIIE